MSNMDRQMSPEWVAAVADSIISRVTISSTGGPQWLGDCVMSPDLILEISQQLLWHGVAEWDLFEVMEDCNSLDHLMERLEKDLGLFWNDIETLDDLE